MLLDQPTSDLFRASQGSRDQACWNTCTPRFGEVQPWTMLANPLPAGTDEKTGLRLRTVLKIQGGLSVVSV